MSSHRVLLVVPPHLAPRRQAKDVSIWSFLAFPYGTLVLATYISKNAPQHVVKVVDMNLDSPDQQYRRLVEALESFKPDIVGISLMFDTSRDHLRPISQAVKYANASTLVVIGGASATTWWNEILADEPYVDGLCYSEGEIAMCDLLNSDDPWSQLAQDPWITRESLSEGRMPRAKQIDRLDDVVAVDYRLVDVSRYHMEESFSPFKHSGAAEHTHFYLGTSRGCPFRCVFCALPSLNGRSMRYASLDAIERHVCQLSDEYGMTVLTIYDDQLLFNRTRAKALFRMLAKYHLRIEAPSGFAVAYIDDEMAELMRDAGLDTVTLAIESGSDYVLKHVIHKPLEIRQVGPAVRALRRTGMFVKAFFVIGVPGERTEDRQLTTQFIKDVGIDWSSINLAYPFRGTEMYDLCVKEGYIKQTSISEANFGQYIIEIPGAPAQETARSAYLMNLDVNFVNNYRMSRGEYSVAARCFEDIVARFDKHAFAHYYLALAYRHITGKEQAADENMKKFTEIVAADDSWLSYAKHFGIN